MENKVRSTGSLWAVFRGRELGTALRSIKITDAVLKRGFDVFVSGFGLLVLSPLFFVIGVLIKLDSSGPVFYRGVRIGKDGKPFGMLKFRTMRDVPVDIGPRVTAQDDPRITRLGRILRHTKLNELPQLVNVLRGEMSLVGPRPEDPQYVALYTPEQRRVLSITPGITSIASIAYHDEESMLSQETLDDVYLNEIMPHKLELDLTYLNQRTLWVDLDILWQTVRVLSPHFVHASPEIEELLCGPVQCFIRRRLSWFSLDWILGFLAVAMANVFWRRAGARMDPSWLHRAVSAAAIAFVFTLVNQIYGLHHSLWACASSQEVIDILVSTVFSTLLLLVGGALVFGLALERIALTAFFAFILFVAARYRRRLVRSGLKKGRTLWRKLADTGRTRVLVVGTDGVSLFLAAQLQNQKPPHAYQLVGFVDDDLSRRGLCIHGCEVLGSCRAIPALVAEHSVDLLVVTVGQTCGDRLEDILRICRGTPAQVKVIPDLMQLIADTGESRLGEQTSQHQGLRRETAPTLPPME